MSVVASSVYPLRRRQPAHLVLTAGLVAWLTGSAVILLFARDSLSTASIERIGLVTVIAALLLVRCVLGPRWVGFASVYVIYLSIAHYGLVAAMHVSADALDSFHAGSLGWLSYSAYDEALAAAAIGVAACSVGVAFAGRRRVQGVRAIAGADRGDRGVYVIGLMLLCAAAVYCVAAMSLGILPLLSGHGAYVAAIQGLAGYPHMLFALATGFAFCLACGTRRGICFAAAVFAVPAILMLVAGNRGEVLYPAAAGVAIAGHRGWHPGWRAVTFGVVMFFLVIPMLRVVRNTPLRDITAADMTIAWTDPFVEIGFTLRPLVETVAWRGAGEDLAGGGTYVLPLARGLTRVAPVAERPTLEGNRLHIDERLAGQGYSVIAEAFFNFGHLGVWVILSAVGCLLIRFGDRSKTPQQLAIAGAIMAVLINNIRNVFMFVPGQLVTIVVLYALARALARAMHSRGVTRFGADRSVAGAAA